MVFFGVFTTQLATASLGFGWPAYQSFKAISLGNNELLKEWLKYWIIMALFLAVQLVADTTIFWLPLYYDAKVAFIVVLWHPKVRGAVQIYDQYLEPLMRSQEATIDKQLAETKARSLDYVNRSFNRAKQYALTHTSSVMEQMQHFIEKGTGTGTAAAAADTVNHPHKD